MEIDFKQYTKNRISFYEKLSEYKLSQFEKSRTIVLKNILFKNLNSEFEDFFKRRSEKDRLSNQESKEFNDSLLEKYPDFKEIFEHNGPAIYWFKIIHSEKSTNTKVIKKFITNKKNKKGWWSKPGKNLENNSEILYLGKVEKNLKNRYIQHLGLGHKMTSSLKLCQWMNQLENIDLEFQFIKIDKESKTYLEDIENVLWRNHNPLIGAEPRIKE
jgi:hypothetical protein